MERLLFFPRIAKKFSSRRADPFLFFFLLVVDLRSIMEQQSQRLWRLFIFLSSMLDPKLIKKHYTHAVLYIESNCRTHQGIWKKKHTHTQRILPDGLVLQRVCFFAFLLRFCLLWIEREHLFPPPNTRGGMMRRLVKIFAQLYPFSQLSLTHCIIYFI